MDRRDLTHAAAIVVSLPDMSGSEQILDRSERALLSQAFAWGEEAEETRQRFQVQIARDVREAIAVLPEAYVLDTVESRPYHIGPHAQGWPLYLVRFIEDARPLLNDAALLWTLGQATHAIISKARVLIGNWYGDSESAPISISEPMLQSLAYAHAFSTYGLDGTVTLKSSYRAPFPGYGEPEHFGGRETYLIQVGASAVTYCYVLNSKAYVTEHFRVFEGQVTPLPLPNWHGDEHFSRQSPHDIRATEVMTARTNRSVN